MATTVTLSILRNRLDIRTAGRSSSLTADEHDDYLIHAFKYEIPHEVSGYLTDGEWSQTTSNGVSVYDLGATVHSLKTPILLDGEEIETFTRIENWNMDHNPTDSDSGQPTRVLIYGTAPSSGTYAVGFTRPVIRVYPIPDSTVYTLSGAARLYPDIDLSSADGTTLLEDSVLVKAILAGAAREFASDYAEEEMEAKEEKRFMKAVNMLRSRSLTPVHEAQFLRTF